MSVEGMPRRWSHRVHAFLGSPGTAVAVVLALLFLAPSLYVLWWVPTQTVAQVRMPPSQSPFPRFPVPDALHVVTVPQGTNESTRLELISLQGLVNRNGEGLYLDVDDETGNATSILTFAAAHYGLLVESLSVDQALDRYAPQAAGLVVVDPARPESMNIATILAGLDDAMIAGPDTAPLLEHRFGLPVLLDYGSSDWASLDAVSANDRALEQLYPRCNPDLLAILPPEDMGTRDYLIATRTFVFYNNQGVLASPAELTSTERILHAAPRGIPVLGWFRSPTLTEENAFVQMVSGEGKFVIDTASVPNVSVLTSLGRGQVLRQGAPVAGAGGIGPEDKVYAVVAVADGDSLDFASKRMMALWNDPARGSFPVAWSVNPLFLDLAPPFMDYYYGGATRNDEFVAAPSGAGYLYPDYMGPGDLAAYLAFAAPYVQRANLDTAWLLNAFTASEIQYSGASLSAYVDGLSPRGIVLDYDDQPTTAAYWMQAGTTSAAPVIRSTQLWTTEANFLGKAGAALAAQGPGPRFLWMTVYPWRFDLTEAKRVLDDLATQTGRTVQIVSPAHLFGLMTSEFQSRGTADLASMQADPIAATLFGGLLSAAQDHLAAARTAATVGDVPRAAYESYLASDTLRQAELREDLVVATACAAVLGIVALAWTQRRHPARVPRPVSLARPFAVGATFALLQVDLGAVLRGNFWTYGYVLGGAVAVLFAAPFAAFLSGRYPKRALTASTALLVLASGMTAVTAAAFPLAMLLGASVLREEFRDRGSPRLLLAAFLGGTAAGLFAPAAVLVLGVLGPVAVAGTLPLALPRPAARESTHAPGAWGCGLLVVMPLLALTSFLSYSVALRLEVQGSNLEVLGVAVLALGAVIALALSALVPRLGLPAFRIRALGVAILFSLGTLVVRASVTTTLMLLGASAAFGLAAWAFLEDRLARGGRLDDMVGPVVVLTPLTILFLRLPPVAFSLSTGGLPQFLEYALYAPPVIWAALGAVLALLALRRRPAPA